MTSVKQVYNKHMFLKLGRPHLSVVHRMSPEEVVMLSAAYIIIHKSINRKKRRKGGGFETIC